MIGRAARGVGNIARLTYGLAGGVTVLSGLAVYGLWRYPNPFLTGLYDAPMSRTQVAVRPLGHARTRG